MINNHTKFSAIVHYKQFGGTVRKIAKRYGVSKSSVSRWFAESTTFDRKVGAKVPQPRSRIHKILHCRNSKGASRLHGGTWNRDVNAARNILMLLQLEVRGAARPVEFMPAQLSTRRKASRLPGESLVPTPSVIPGLPASTGSDEI